MDPTPTPTPVPTPLGLYVINQTSQPMMECWISYKPDSRVKEAQTFYVSNPILVGPTLTFINNILVPTTLPSQAGDPKADDDKRPGGNVWELYWRDESNSLNGTIGSAPIGGVVTSFRGIVTLYVVGGLNNDVIRVNQQGATVGTPIKWEPKLKIVAPAPPPPEGSQVTVTVDTDEKVTVTR